MTVDHAQYLRARAAEFANLAITTTDPVAAQNLHGLAILCQESAERLERRVKQPEPVSTPAR